MGNFKKGDDYDRLLADFLMAGGDLTLCPFDAKGYKYEAPPYDKSPSNENDSGEDV